jgi:hypothetical protein
VAEARALEAAAEAQRSSEESALVERRREERAGRGFSEQEARAQEAAIRRITRDRKLTPKQRALVI